MSDRFRPLSMRQLSNWIADELEIKKSVFGVPRDLFFRPTARDSFRSSVYGQPLETPLGVAAGPHSQLAQNIIVAWLCGARFIELKTVQTLDRIEVSKPCIDMQDEGYNVEWSQELLVEESFTEYLNAWVLIHALHRRLGFPGDSPGMIFNLSVGYDLAGIRRANMQWFLDKVEDAGADLHRAFEIAIRRFPELGETRVPARLSDNVTLSTMHGCPSEEIGAISEYLLRERRLHTSVKLNPTLLGAARVREILNESLGFKQVLVPDEAFAHDLGFDDALSLVRGLQRSASSLDLQFGVKLTNTLEVTNHRRVFAEDQQMMYLSGRPLHALTVNLAHALAAKLEEPLLMSFSGGADATNVAPLLQCGMRTVTICSDLLKPGGYLRLEQYLENLSAAVTEAGAATLEEFVLAGAPGHAAVTDAGMHNLGNYAKAVLSNPLYHAETYDRSRTKTARHLDFFDCIEAPCVDSCDVNQRVPEYMRLVQTGDVDGAARITRADNPLASILGRTCHHPCESVCLRTHMDQPLAIREIKRFITEHERPPGEFVAADSTAARVAVIGGGPCGLSAATFLARAGLAVTIFEARPESGGMVSATIPDYRAPSHSVERDLEHLRALGVETRHNQEVGTAVTLASLRADGFSSIVVAVGARHGLRLGLDGEQVTGVLDGLDFLRAARNGNPQPLGMKIGVVGGGDVAMDCSRTACRLSDGEVTVFYRRTRAEMPAQKEELLDLFDEGGRLQELAAPSRIIANDGRLSAVIMTEMRLGEPDASGRRRPEPIPGADRMFELDTLIVAIGQRPDLSIFGDEEIELDRSGYLKVDPVTFETSLPGVFAGGDIVGDGPSSIVEAAGDGRHIAEAIIARHRGPCCAPHETAQWPDFDHVGLLRRRARVEPRVAIPHLAPAQRYGFAEVVVTLSKDEAEREASRCVDCDLMCSTCDSVCPNRAILTYRTRPGVLDIPQFQVKNHQLTPAPSVAFRITQGPQVAVLADACNECGNCVTFCPTSDRPWLDKPRLYFHRGDFEAETDNAFMLFQSHSGRGIQARFDGGLHQLIEIERELRYTTGAVALRMESTSLAVIEPVVLGDSIGGIVVNPNYLGTMITLHRAFAESIPEFPLVEMQADWAP